MRGRRPKAPELRQRTHKSVSTAVLSSVEESAGRKVPPLPKRESEAEVWHPRVLEWWASIHTSPMAAEILASDIKGGLYLLAELYQKRWTTKETKVLVALASEIRQQEIRFGLSPMDRRRLQWSIEQGETAAERTKSRQDRKRLDEVAKKDPRSVLKAV